jgi:lantibiotic biosynthesis protein
VLFLRGPGVMRLYRCVDAAVVRAATHPPDGLAWAPWPDLTGGTGDQVAQWRCWLARVWAQDSIAEAIEVASPVLARRIREVCDGRRHQARQVRRMVVSVARYLLRMTSRATPFGLFAGVAPVRFGSGLTVRWGADHRVVARVDAVWLAGVITRLEACPELLRRLPVVANNLCFLRGGRLVLPCQQHAGGSGRSAPAEVSVRHTRAVELAVQATRSPIRVGDLAGELTTEYPRTPGAVIEGTLAELVAQGILVSGLRPPMTVTDPLAYVIEQLSTVNAGTIAHVAPQVHRLREIHDELAWHNRACSPGERRSSRVSVTERMSSLSGLVEQPLAVDLRLDCAMVLPRRVACEAEAAMSALTRLTRYPVGVPEWQDYHARFLDRYGIGALVPVADLVHAEAGLGFPARYRGSLREASAPGLSARDVRLLTLAQRVALDGGSEAVLDDRMISELADDALDKARVPPHAELSFHLHAPSRDALDRGNFVLVVAGTSRAAGTMAGRFLDLLDPADRDRMTGAYADLPTVHAGALPVQVSCPPLYPQTENVARTPAVLSRMISLAQHPVPGSSLIPLDDLAVSADAQRLYLVSLPDGQPVETSMLNAVDLWHRTQPIARFLCEITTAQAAYLPFSWGAASRLPFLPRLRYGRTVLAPARWNLAASDLPGKGTSWSQWKDSLAAWRRRFRLPRAVFLGEADLRLRLDLDQGLHLALLRSGLDRSGHATLREAPGTEAFGWLDGRAHEIVVPLVSTSKPRRPPVPRRATPVHVIGRDHGHLPGDSGWLFVKLYGHPDRHTAILTIHLPSLLSRWGEPPPWWFLPYRDPEDHLRLRLRLPDVDAFGQAAGWVGGWAAGLRRLGLLGKVQLDTYYPEAGRFGSGPAMAAAESVFATDSASAIAQRTPTARPGATGQLAVTAASLVDLTVSFLGDTGAGLRWLFEHIARDHAPASTREAHDQAIRLANPRDRWTAIRALPGGAHIATAWARRRTALAGYRQTLTATGEADPDSVLPALLHLHCVRMAGIAPDIERTCHHLARAAALSWTVHAQASR